MNRRKIAMLLALLLALSGACLADGGDAREIPSALEAESAPAREAQAEPAKEAQPEPAAEAQPEPAKEAQPEAADGGEESSASGEQNPAGPEEGTPEGGSESGGAEEPSGGEASGGSGSGEAPGDVPSPQETPEAAPTAEPEATPEPGTDSTPQPSSEPESSPEPGTSPEPEDSPEPGDSPEPAGLVLSAEGGTLLADGSWQISIASPEDVLRFRWTEVEGANGYVWEIADAEGNPVASGAQAGAQLELSAGNYLSGRYALTVRAQLADGAEVAEARIIFSLKQEEQSGGGQPGGFPGGSGGRPSGGSSGGSGGGASSQADSGLQITPGVALTDDHASGSRDMTAYGAVALTIDEAEQRQLALGGMELGISRADGGEFAAELSDGALILRAEEGTEWSVNLLALEVLARSGVTELALCSGGSVIRLPANLALKGPIYASYRASGRVSKDFELRASPTGIAAIIDTARYALQSDGSLAPESEPATEQTRA